ncbi:MAG: hypothetical protein ABF648_01950 [Propionibacterium sp.]
MDELGSAGTHGCHDDPQTYQPVPLLRTWQASLIPALDKRSSGVSSKDIVVDLDAPLSRSATRLSPEQLVKTGISTCQGIRKYQITGCLTIVAPPRTLPPTA